VLLTIQRQAKEIHRVSGFVQDDIGKESKKGL